MFVRFLNGNDHSDQPISGPVFEWLEKPRLFCTKEIFSLQLNWSRLAESFKTQTKNRMVKGHTNQTQICPVLNGSGFWMVPVLNGSGFWMITVVRPVTRNIKGCL
jgi:hypothetical protein